MDTLGGGDNQANPIFIQRRDNTGWGSPAIAIHTEAASWINEARFIVRGTDNDGDMVNSPRYSYGEWYHYAGIVTEDSIAFFINGELIGRIENQQNENYDEYIDWVDIGRHRYQNDDHGFFNGTLDEIRIWDFPKNQNEIIENMFKIHVEDESGLVALWTFDDDSGEDLTGNGFDGVFQGDAFTEINNFLIGTCENPGDLNMDTQIDITDLLLAVDFLLERDPSNANYWCADLTGDGWVNIFDIVSFANLILRR